MSHLEVAYLYHMHKDTLTTVFDYSYLRSFLAEVLWLEIDASPLPSQALFSDSETARERCYGKILSIRNKHNALA